MVPHLQDLTQIRPFLNVSIGLIMLLCKVPAHVCHPGYCRQSGGKEKGSGQLRHPSTHNAMFIFLLIFVVLLVGPSAFPGPVTWPGG